MQKSIAERAADPPSQILFEANVQIARDRVVLRLWQHAASLCVLERQLVRSDAVVLAQILSLEDGDALAEFAAADPYGDHLYAQYQSIDRKRREQLAYQAKPKTGRRPVDLLEEIGRIEACSNEGELMTITQRVITQLGGQSYTYRWLHVEEKTGDVDEHRCLVGCHPAWMHKYFNRLWYMNDPFLEYAKRNAAPAVGSRIELYSDDHWALDEAVEYGFRSTLICPAHSRSNALAGVLQVSNEQPQSRGEGVLWEHRVLLRALAAELLDWRIAALRQGAISQFDLDQRDLAVLRMLRSGGAAQNVANSLGVSERTVYGIFRKINEKLGTPHIAKAVATVAANGLIE